MSAAWNWRGSYSPLKSRKRPACLDSHTKSRRAIIGLPLQWIFHPWRRSLDQPPQLRLHFLHPALHLPSDLAVAEVAFDAAPQTGNVLGFGEIHLEQKPRAGPKRQ